MSRDDYEEFMALRKQIRKLQQGTPLLMNSGHDELEICGLELYLLQGICQCRSSFKGI